MSSSDSCLFCKIIAGSIPCAKIYETEQTLAFLDIFPTSRGHALVIPKHHAEKVHELPASSLADLAPVLGIVARAIVDATGVHDYNVLQNNGEAAHQVIKHVHFHIIPKPDADQGLGVEWPAKEGNTDALAALAKQLSDQLSKK
jgi:diadenosine tetraphosphate (Ap4A) HIT family hydrolase